MVFGDNPAVLKLVCRTTEEHGFIVDKAGSASTVMRLLDQSTYNSVIADQTMPVIGGYTLASWIKQKFNDTQVIIMTSRIFSDVGKFTKTGILDRWLFKPFSLKELCSLLQTPG